MSQNRDQAPPASEDYLSKALLQSNDQTLSAARDALKRKILRSTLQRAIGELGSPVTIAEMAMEELDERGGVFQRAQGLIRERLIDLLLRRSTEALADAEAVAGEALGKVDGREEALLNAQHALKARLVESVARRAAGEIGDADAVAEQAMGRLYEMQGLDGELDALAQARSATRHRLIGMVARRSVEDLGEADAAAEQAMGRIDRQSAAVVKAAQAVKERLLEEVVRHSADEIGSADAVAEQAMGRLYENNEAIQKARGLLKERLLSAILEQTLQEINDEVGLGGEDFAGALPAGTDVEGGHDIVAPAEAPPEAPSEEPTYDGIEGGDGAAESEAAPDVEAALFDQSAFGPAPTSEDEAAEAEAPKAEAPPSETPLRYPHDFEVHSYGEEPEVAFGDGHAAPFEDETDVSAFDLAGPDWTSGEPGWTSAEDEAAPAFDGADVPGEAFAAEEPPAFDGAPAPEEAPEADAPIFYVYGVVAGEEELAPGILPATGLDEAYAPYAVRHGDMHVILSKLSTSTFSTEALQANLKDKRWKSEYKSRHYRVLDEVMAAGHALIPMPFGTIYSDEQRVEEVLSGRRGYLEEVLQRLEGRREWSLKIHRDADRLSEAVQRSSDVDHFISELPELIASGFREGMASSTDEDSRVILENCANYSHQTLRAFADEAVLKTIQVNGGEEEEGWVVMEAVYLVHGDKEQAFEDALGRIERKYADLGFSYEVAGPRAPLSFCE